MSENVDIEDRLESLITRVGEKVWIKFQMTMYYKVLTLFFYYTSKQNIFILYSKSTLTF